MHYFLALAAAGVRLAAAQAAVRLALLERVDPLITPGGAVTSLPPVGFGTWMLPNDARGADAVARAIKVGYRHLDGATAYQNQDAVGKGIALALKNVPGLKREHLWVTTGCGRARRQGRRRRHRREQQAARARVRRPRAGPLPYREQPAPGHGARRQGGDGAGGRVRQQRDVGQDGRRWRCRRGKIRHIGIGNFNVTQLESLLAVAKVKPLVRALLLSTLRV